MGCIEPVVRPYGPLFGEDFIPLKVITMSKLNTFKQNLIRQKAERAAAQTKSTTSTTCDHTPARDFVDMITSPPAALVALYRSEIQAYTEAHILGDSTRTTEQIKMMLEDCVMRCYHNNQAHDAMSMSNRSTYWKPTVTHSFMEGFKIALGSTCIAVIS